MGVMERWTLGPARAAAVAAMPDTATILRNAPASGPGGWSQDFVAIGTTKCWLTDLPSAAEQLASAELAAITHYRLAVPNGTDIKPADRIVFNGKTFEVQGGLTEASLNMTDAWYLVEVRQT